MRTFGAIADVAIIALKKSNTDRKTNSNEVGTLTKRIMKEVAIELREVLKIFLLVNFAYTTKFKTNNMIAREIA